MVAMRSIRPWEHLWLKNHCLLGAYVWRAIAFGMPNPCGWSYRLCTGAATTMLKSALVGAGPSLWGFQDLISQDSFTILCASEDSQSLMGGVMLCIVSRCC